MAPKISKIIEPNPQADVLTAPRVLLEDAKGRASRENKRRNLDLLWDALVEIRNEGGRGDYSLAEVGRRLEQLGGPKIQSLRNTGGSDFRNVIESFRDATHGSGKYFAKTKSSLDRALEAISDPTDKALLCLEIANAKKLRVENANLRSAFERLNAPVGTEISVTPDAHISATQDLEVGNVLPTLAQSNFSFPDNRLPVTEEGLVALRTGLDRRRIQLLGFKVMQDGAIENARGDMIFPPGFATACEAVLATYEKQVKEK